MARPRQYQIQPTKLSQAIMSIRKRLGMGQVAFTLAITGGAESGLISRYERGHLTPGLKPLIALFALAELRKEKEPLLRALREQGIERMIADLRTSGLLSDTTLREASPCAGEGNGAN